MRLRVRRQPEGTWLEHELCRRAWTYQDLARRAGISRMTIYFLLHPGEYGRVRKRRRGTVIPRTAHAIAEALAGTEGDVAGTIAQCFEIDAGSAAPETRRP